jgi:hypothetical protein
MPLREVESWRLPDRRGPDPGGVATNLKDIIELGTDYLAVEITDPKE